MGCRSVGHTEGSKRLRLRRPDQCATCGKELAVGSEARWYRDSRVVTCPDCVLLESPLADVVVWEPRPVEEIVLAPVSPEPELEPPPVDVGRAGASALREYERLRK